MLFHKVFSLAFPLLMIKFSECMCVILESAERECGEWSVVAEIFRFGVCKE